MDFEFSIAQKRRDKEKAQRIEEATRKREAEAKRKAIAEQEMQRIQLISEQRREKEAEERALQEQKMLEEEARTGGIKYCQVLTAVPTTNDGERITLPVSALESLEAQSAIDPSRPLTFELALLNENGGEVSVISLTHVGVWEFTAQEGTVGIPPKTALSLTRERGGGITKLRVKYVKLPLPTKSFVRLQPRGDGFHALSDSVSLDIKSVLERELSRHTAISRGDWLPIRHEKVSYELVVVNLEPNDAISLVNTDLEVDLLPSENFVAEQEKKVQAEEAAAAAALHAAQVAMKRSEHAQEVRLNLPQELPNDTPESVLILIRLPKGNQSSRRFRRADPLKSVFEWICCQEAVVELGIDQQNVTLTMNYPKRVYTIGDMDLTLSAAGLTGKREALYLQDASSSLEDTSDVVDASGGGGGDAMDIDEKTPVQAIDQVSESALSEEWISAAQLQKANLDRQLSDEGRAAVEEVGSEDQQGSKSDKVSIFHMLVAEGFEKQVAANAAQKYGDSIHELYHMGFQNHKLNIELLKRYGGRMLRVVNALSERPVEYEDIKAYASPPVTPSTQGNIPVPQQAQIAQSFETKFAELVSQGVPPNEAAAQALLSMQAPPAPVETQQTSVSTPSVSSNLSTGKWRKELEELSMMGFVEQERNIMLLERYQGRLVRVVNVLAGAE